MRRGLLLAFLLAVAASCAATALSDSTAGATGPTAIRQENALPGDAGWSAAPIATGRAIEGYASSPSALPGETIGFHVSTVPAARYRVRVYRLGWYGGAGARLISCLPSCTTDTQGHDLPVPPPDANGEVRAHWPTTDELLLPAASVSGYYLAQFMLTTGPQMGSAAATYFIVRDPSERQSQFLVQVPVNTWQAYNGWGGKSLYDFSSTSLRPANRVSFERPYAAGLPGTQGPLGWEYPLVRFLEREGYDVSYQTDLDTDRDPRSLLRHRLVITAGHGEYWTGRMRDAFTVARDAGTNLAFLGANTGYWQVRYEDGGSTIVGYKSLYDPNPDPRLKTAMFRELTPPRYECELLGIQHQGVGLAWPQGDYTVTAAGGGDRWFAGTGFAAGDVVQGIVSIETDTIPGNQTAASSCGHALTVFFHREHGGDKDGNADAVRYVAPSGARVFSSGSHQFVWGLDDVPGDPFMQHGLADTRLQRFMRNVLDDLGRPAPVVLLSADQRSGGRLFLRLRRRHDPRVLEIDVVQRPMRPDRDGAPADALRRVCTPTDQDCVIPRCRRRGACTVVAVDRWGHSDPVVIRPTR